MQGVLCLPPGQLQDYTMPNKITDMEMTEQSTKEINQSDSGIYSAKDSSHKTIQSNNDSDNRSDCSSPDRKFFCIICKRILTSQHEFTLHIRSHNNDVTQDPDKGYTCRICNKELSSSSSLDRHVLVHSGERPFTCKYCGDTFTTNGNMHRHMRTHKDNINNYESDGSVDSAASAASKTSECNNNNRVEMQRTVDKRKQQHDDVVDLRPRKRAHLESANHHHHHQKCPICHRGDFVNGKSLDLHMEDHHPDHWCHQCNQTFSNPKLLNYHRAKVHAASGGDSIGKVQQQSTHHQSVLTGIDFSSDLFAKLALFEYESAGHMRGRTTSGPKFPCHKCSREFASQKTLELHVLRDCGLRDQSLLNIDRIRSRGCSNMMSESERNKIAYLLSLKLQNSPEKCPPNNADYIKTEPDAIDNNGSMIDYDDEDDDEKANNEDILAPIPSIISMTTNGSSLLKQLQAGGKSTDVATAASIDMMNAAAAAENCKSEEAEETQDVFAIEVRKMKMRGEFPCKLCDAVFPNLRALKGHNRVHLNNAHNGTYRCNMCPHWNMDKAALIRHMRTHNGDRPYECSLCNYAFTTKANCERHLRNRHGKSTRDEVKKAIIYHPSEDPTNDPTLIQQNKNDAKTPNTSTNSIIDEDTSPESLVVPAFPQTFPPAFSPTSSHSTFITSTPTKQAPEKKEPEAFTKEQTAALDLSKKKSSIGAAAEEKRDDSNKQILNHLEPPNNPISNPFASSDILTKQLLKETPNPTLFYARLYESLLKGGMAPLHPWMFPPGPPMLPNSEPLCRYPNGYSPIFSPINLENKQQSSTIKPENLKPLSINTEPNYADTVLHMANGSPVMMANNNKPPDMMAQQSPNSTRMVIKNGVLMPKQKQRRYRTERPFSCEHCAARFTLRSNMERHIKQQHPQYWSQRNRSAMGHPGRKPQIQLSAPTTTTPSKNVPPYELNIPSYDVINNKPTTHDLVEETTKIGDKLRYAILQQHLKTAQEQHSEIMRARDREEDALVIDDDDDDDDDDVDRRRHRREERLIIKKEPRTSGHEVSKSRGLEDKMRELREKQLMNEKLRSESAAKRDQQEAQDLVPVSKLLDNASQQQFQEYFRRDGEENDAEGISEEDEEGLVASGSTSDGNSGTDENRSESDNATNQPEKKKSAYSLAPNRVCCPYCSRKFPWTSSLRRHILTHTGQKPFKCSHCTLLFTTKSNCDRHLLRKHGNSATTISNDTANNNNNNFMMRNVPERPFKCSNCPSSTFSTYSNLKKHMSSKHGAHDDRQGYEAGSSEDEKNNSDHKSDWEAQISRCRVNNNNNNNGPDVQQQQQVVNSDLPFKCHLCDSSFSDRQECLDHIKDRHVSEYDLLMHKNALDANASTPDEGANHVVDNNQEEDNEIRGKFPDYSNRKVICAFCMRRFWSAEDLRRHMRTHTGERPFSCDICRRRFTLKHSMLRHRKKHDSSMAQTDAQSDEDNNVAVLGGGGMRHSADKLSAERSDESDNGGTECRGDLISNLLGIKDNIIEQVLTSASADDAAKLLGVERQE